MAAQTEFTLTVLGTQEYRAFFSPQKVAKVAAAALDALLVSGIMIEGQARRNAPVRTGNLRARITHTLRIAGDLISVLVGTNVEYAAFVEFGTGQRGGAGVGALEASARDAMKVLGYTHGTVAGMTARPFLFPAYETHRQGTVERVGVAVRKALVA